MKVSNLRKKRQSRPQAAASSTGKSSAVQLGLALQALAEPKREAVVFSYHQDVFEVRIVGNTKIKVVPASVNSVRTKKVLKIGRRRAKDARFSRATQLLNQDESSETTANIAQKFEATLEHNKEFYDKLLRDLVR